MTTNRTELARALRQARERVRPGDVGLPVGTHRRVPGLRREEVAMLAGISPDYIVRLEQGRGPHPSGQVLGALARALRLSTDERSHVFRLAGATPPQPGTIEMSVPPGVLRLLDRVVDLPAMVVSAKGDVLAWNAMSAALNGDWSALSPLRRNHARLLFLPDPCDPPHAVLGGSQEAIEEGAAQMVGNLRGRWAATPRTRACESCWRTCIVAPSTSGASGRCRTPRSGAATPRRWCTLPSVT